MANPLDFLGGIVVRTVDDFEKAVGEIAEGVKDGAKYFARSFGEVVKEYKEGADERPPEFKVEQIQKVEQSQKIENNQKKIEQNQKVEQEQVAHISMSFDELRSKLISQKVSSEYIDKLKEITQEKNPSTLKRLIAGWMAGLATHISYDAVQGLLQSFGLPV